MIALHYTALLTQDNANLRAANRRSARNGIGRIGRYRPVEGDEMESHAQGDLPVRQIHHILGPRLGAVGVVKLATGLMYVKIALSS